GGNKPSCPCVSYTVRSKLPVSNSLLCCLFSVNVTFTLLVMSVHTVSVVVFLSIVVVIMCHLLLFPANPARRCISIAERFAHWISRLRCAISNALSIPVDTREIVPKIGLAANAVPIPITFVVILIALSALRCHTKLPVV